MPGRFFSTARLAVSVLLLQASPFAHAAPHIRYGVGDHPIKRGSALDKPVFEQICRRRLAAYRIDIPLTADTEPFAARRLSALLRLAKPCGVRIVAVLQTGFAWGDRTDAGRYPKGDLDALYRQGYDRVLPFVTQFRGEAIDWELGNELNLLRVDEQGQPLFGSGWTRAEFETPLMREWAAVLRGMSDAVWEAGQGNMRRMLNTTSTNFGFLEFMEAQGVGYEVVDYHYYEPLGTDPANLWGGVRRPYNLFAKLASYGRPVIIGEVNGAEIYNGAYSNRPADALVLTGFRSFKAAIEHFRTQKIARIEAIIAYEMWDEPKKTPPESHFGLLTADGKPKMSMSILTAFAGGPLDQPERERLAAENLLPR